MRGLWEGGQLQNLPCLLCSAVLVGGHRARSQERAQTWRGASGGGGPGTLPRSTGYASLPAGADKGMWPKKDNRGREQRGEHRKLF